MEQEVKSPLKSLPKRKIKIQVKENEYEISYPNTGGLIDIQISKSTLSRDQYESMLYQNGFSGQYSAMLIEMVSVFNTLAPKLKEDLKVRGFLELDVMDTKYLMDIYIKEVYPWMKEWEDILSTPMDQIKFD